MLKREDLAKLSFFANHGFDDAGGLFYVSGARENKSDVTLMAAAPKLALACLKARRFAATAYSYAGSIDSPFAEAAEALSRELESALTAAGVEVE